MTDYLIGGYGPDMGGTATGIARGRSFDDGRFEVGEAWGEIEVPSPSWITIAGDRVLAALEGTGEVADFTIDGALAARGPSGGTFPCHIAVDDDAVMVACYGDGVVAVHMPRVAEPQLLAGAGSGPLPAQEGPHAHHVLPLDAHVLTVDLGSDLLHVHHRVDSGLARVDSVPMPAGTGPRDLLSLPDGRLAVLGEWSCELVLLEPRGDTLEIVQVVALPGATQGVDQASGLALTSDGRFVVAGIRGSNRIATLAIDDTITGVGWAPSGGDWPRHLVVDGDFVHVANQLSNSVATLRIADDGTLSPHGDPVSVPSPTCLAPVSVASNL